ncbi:MAG: DNA polymerase III subunit gamma/tau [Pseudomonadota bacterium]
MTDAAPPPYRVLARKYRPRHFGELIGQEALVRTLTNAIESGRVAQGFMLTGVRGVGKTTTARIIARALNYAGPDGTSGPTTGPTDDCGIAQAIAEGRHPDVLEMDAASHTGVDAMRDILDSMRYAPTQARYKVYIIDEVHMLSTSAFNALLKTLEEPPAHVKFIFATTEIRKVPLTILSRCQRFDLRRIDVATLTAHYLHICELEGVPADADAITLIARAADGSVRDGLSLLDQAIAMGNGAVTLDLVTDMLGTADRGAAFTLLSHLLRGEVEPALNAANDMLQRGTDPAVIMEDLLEFAHVLTRLKAAPQATDTLAGHLSPDIAAAAAALCGTLSMSTLSRAWQLLLKGAGEVQYAPDPAAALDIVLIRLCYTADLPDPADLLRQLQDGSVVAATAPRQASAAPDNNGPRGMRAVSASMAAAVPVAHSHAAPAPAPANANLDSLSAIVALLEDTGHMILASQVRDYIQLIQLQPQRIECTLAPGAPADLSGLLSKRLTELTGQRWFLTLQDKGIAQDTLRQQDHKAEQIMLQQIQSHPTVKAVLDSFPDSKITAISSLKTE